MARPTYRDAANWARRVDSFGTSLKSPSAGGPILRDYTNTNAWEKDSSWKREHPVYPEYYYPDDKDRDTHYAMKQLLARTQALGQVHADPGDIQYYLDKKNAQEMVLFKAFVEDSIPRGTPWARDFFERIMPGWYQSKVDIINDKMSIINRFIDMTIRGPQNIDDMFLLYQLYNGKIKIPSNWAELIYGPSTSALKDADFASGLFCPKKWITTQMRLTASNQQFLANFAIPGIDTKGLKATAVLNDRSGWADLDAELKAAESGAASMGSIKASSTAGDGFFGRKLVAGDTDVDFQTHLFGREAEFQTSANRKAANAEKYLN